MVCMSSNAIAPRVIRTGAQIAGRLGAKWYAVYVETPQEQPGCIKPDDSEALRQNIELAKNLGATVVKVHAMRPADGLIAFARREGITHVTFRPERAFALGAAMEGIDHRSISYDRARRGGPGRSTRRARVTALAP
jgi:two-component system sensor histidine kinase KdpD